jgi:NAD(P)-dependent dehydrogenase (short-subunit alcohol dehydrogenase family)
VKPRFTGRPAIVTAAGSGIGRAIALRLHEEGAKVLAVDINAESLAQLPVSDTLRTLPSSETSQRKPMCPLPGRLAAALAAASALRSAMAMVRPSSARRWALAKPRPLAPPVMRAVRMEWVLSI